MRALPRQVAPSRFEARLAVGSIVEQTSCARARADRPAANIVSLERPEPLAPRVDRLLADAGPLGDDRHRIAIRFTALGNYLAPRRRNRVIHG